MAVSPNFLCPSINIALPVNLNQFLITKFYLFKTNRYTHDMDRLPLGTVLAHVPSVTGQRAVPDGKGVSFLGNYEWRSGT